VTNVQLVATQVTKCQIPVDYNSYYYISSGLLSGGLLSAQSLSVLYRTQFASITAERLSSHRTQGETQTMPTLSFGKHNIFSTVL